MPRPSPAERKRQRLTQRLRYVGGEIFEVAFDAAAEVVRSGYPDVPHGHDPDDYSAGCQASLQDAAEKAVAAAGFDVSDPQVLDEIIDVVQHVQDLESSADLAGTPFDSDPRENWASYRALYGEKSKRPISTCGQRWRRPVGRARSSRRAAPGRRQGSRRSTTRAGPDDDDGESEPPRRGPGRHLHLDADLLLQGGRS